MDRGEVFEVEDFWQPSDNDVKAYVSTTWWVGDFELLSRLDGGAPFAQVKTLISQRGMEWLVDR